jgi:hypothetical protein
VDFIDTFLLVFLINCIFIEKYSRIFLEDGNICYCFLLSGIFILKVFLYLEVSMQPNIKNIIVLEIEQQSNFVKNIPPYLYQINSKNTLNKE